MPTYEYECEECGIVFERFQHFSDEPLKTCPECQGSVHRVIQPVGIIFKGSGFYVTDNRGSKSSTLPKSQAEQASDKGNGESKSKASEPKSSDTKKKA